MRQWLKDLFSETSDISSMRVMAMITLFSAIALAFTNHETAAEFFLATAFAGKCVQKHLENQTPT